MNVIFIRIVTVALCSRDRCDCPIKRNFHNIKTRDSFSTSYLLQGFKSRKCLWWFFLHFLFHLLKFLLLSFVSCFLYFLNQEVQMLQWKHSHSSRRSPPSRQHTHNILPPGGSSRFSISFISLSILLIKVLISPDSISYFFFRSSSPSLSSAHRFCPLYRDY